MNITLHQINGTAIAELISDQVLITETQDALDIMGDVTYNGCQCIVMHEKNITPDFFDLKTRIAGDILQKFSTYGVRLAIVGDFSKYDSKSLRDFIYESNKYRHINFAATVEEAIERIAGSMK